MPGCHIAQTVPTGRVIIAKIVCSSSVWLYPIKPEVSVGAGMNMLSAVTGSHFVLGLKGIGRPKRSKEVWWRMPMEQVWALLTPHVHSHPMPLWSLTCAQKVWFLPTSSAVLEVRSLISLHLLLLALQNAVDTIFSLLEGG